MNSSATLGHLANRYSRHYYAATTYSPDPCFNAQHMAIAKRLDRAIRYLNGRLNRSRSVPTAERCPYGRTHWNGNLCSACTDS